MTYVDSPDKRQKHPHFEHRTEKLDRKDNHFTSKKFHEVRKVSTHKKILKSLGRIGMCLNDKSTTSLPTGDLDKVCFILINDYYKDDDYELGVGPLNDGYLVGLTQHRLGFKFFYLYNSNSEEFGNWLRFFISNSQEALTVFYTGRTNEQGIEFKGQTLEKTKIAEIIAKNCTGKTKVIFVTDSMQGGSVFPLDGFCPENAENLSNMVSFFVKKSVAGDSKEAKRTHGIFTYYLKKFIMNDPRISPNRLLERMTPSLRRFDEIFHFEISNLEVADQPLFV